MKLAALDVDGTLYAGTLGFALLDELRAAGRVSARAVRHVHRTMREHRGAGALFRDTTGPASSAYGRAMEGVRHTDAVRASHTAWRRVRDRLLDSTGPLLEHLRRTGHTPVLLSGSPQEMVDRLAGELGVTHRFGMRLTHAADGTYTRGFAALPAVPEVKSELLRGLAHGLGADLRTALAVGNSASDHALLAAVGHPVAFEPDDALRTLARARGWAVADRHTLVAVVSALTPSLERNLHAHSS
ncbi:haloacid dehalogenase-like hydrolase [Streptomyces sp. NPDC094032]|uniref:HAD family hydrolase n=1 Tax=Streptomyces sp. NPDC094032 TaxID=3155308 RepID=UPI0033273143